MSVSVFVRYRLDWIESVSLKSTRMSREESFRWAELRGDKPEAARRSSRVKTGTSRDAGLGR